MRRTGAPSPVAEDPEEGATLAKLFTSLLSPFDPETESLAEYEERLQQGVEMARLDCRDEAVSLAESCLGEAQFQTAYSRFSNLCRMSPAAARPDGPDHVLRAIGAGITKLLQMPEAAEDARSLPPSSAASVRFDAEAPPAPDFFDEASGVSREAPFRSSASDEPVGGASSVRAHLPERSLPHHYDPASTGNNSGQETVLLASVQEMRRQREQDAKERAEQLKSMREEKSVFTYTLRNDLPVFGDGDSDLDKHLEAFSDVCMVVKPKGDREKLRLFARTLKGTRRRCYDTIIKEAKHNGDYESKPASVFDRVVAALDASFHESDEAKAMKARARYDSLGKRATQFQEFQVSWLEALTELNSAGVYLLYDYLHKIGSFLRDEMSRDRRFWPLRPSPGVKQEFRGVENWSEAALVAREITLRKDANKAVESHHATGEAEPTRSPKNPKNKKNESGNGGADATRAQTVGLPSGTGDRCKHCNNPGHITSLGLKTALIGRDTTLLQRKTSMVPVALHQEDAANTQQDASQTLTAKEKKAAKKKEKDKVSSGSTPREAGAVVYDSSLQVSKDLKTVAAAPSPGYNAQTRTSCAGVELVTLLDSGATCGSLPEWLFAEIYERTAADVARGKYTWDDRSCPIREIDDFSKVFQVVLWGCLPSVKGLQHRVTDAGHRFDKLGLTLPRLELERETFLTDGTELRVETSLRAALETEVSLESNQSAVVPVAWIGEPSGLARVVPVAEGLEVAFGHFDPDLSRDGMVVLHNVTSSECQACHRLLGPHSAALAEVAALGGKPFGGCPACGLLPDAAHGSAPVRARDTVVRFAERLVREQDFSVPSFQLFCKELRAAWYLEPCGQTRGSSRRGAAKAVEPRLGSFRHGGVVGTIPPRRSTGLRRRPTYLNDYLKGRCEDAGVAAESWNSLGKFTGGELWVEDAEAVKTQHRTAPCPWHEELHPPGYKVPVKGGALIKFDARVQHGVLPHTGERTLVVAYSVYLLDEPLISGTALRLGFGASFGVTEAGGLRSKGAWSVFTPLAEAVLMRCSPHSSGPKPDSLLARLTFCSHSGQLLERCFAPMEFLEFTDPEDTLTVFIHEDLTMASNFAELQLAELGFDLNGDRCGPNRVAEGYLIDICRGSEPGDCLVEDEALVDSILNDEVPTEAYYQAYRAFLHEQFAQARVCVLEHIAELVELFDLYICIVFSLGIDKLVLLKPQVKSLGEIVIRHGRSPDPAKVVALSEWGPIGSLKQLQEFLGTANYSRDQIGPKFAVAMDPLRRYLREGDKATCLAVPDERAAANGSRPYEQLADCCKAGEKPATLAMAEFSLSYEERLLDPEEEEGDDAWSMGYEKPFLLQGLFHRAGERPNWVKEMWAETGADAPSDGPLELPFKPGEGRGPEQLLRDQMDDHDTWEILNYLRKGELRRFIFESGGGMPLPMDPKLEQHTLGPWMDVYVDFTGDAMQAVMTCMLRSLTIPAVWRHDLGPEFTNALFEEMTVLLGIQERTPPAHRPMAVGMGETVHHSMNSLIALLLQDVHKACALEWARVLPLVHYIMMNTPILESGLVPRDLDRALSLRDHVERELVPFRAPGQLPVDEWAKAVFRNFKTIESTLSRYLAMTEERRAELYDRGHLKRDCTIGERVWRHPTMRSGTKFQPRSVGPYELRAITGQRATLESEDGTLISNIPLAELIRVPARVFDDSTDFERRSLGDIVGGKPPAPLPGPKGKFGATLPGAMVLYRPSSNRKELIVGRVTQNLRESKAMVIVPYTVSYKSLFREVSMGPNGTLRYADLSAVAWWLLLGRFAHGGSSSQEVIDRDADGAEPVLGQDSTLAASDGAWAPPVPKVPYVSRWTSTHAPGEAAAAKWQSFAQKRQFTEVTEEHRVEYPDLRDEEIRAIGRVIFEKSEVLWVKDTPQTMVHDMVTKGEPVSQAPLIRGGEHAEWLEAEIAKTYRRGKEWYSTVMQIENSLFAQRVLAAAYVLALEQYNASLEADKAEAAAKAAADEAAANAATRSGTAAPGPEANASTAPPTLDEQRKSHPKRAALAAAAEAHAAPKKGRGTHAPSDQAGDGPTSGPVLAGGATLAALAAMWDGYGLVRPHAEEVLAVVAEEVAFATSSAIRLGDVAAATLILAATATALMGIKWTLSAKGRLFQSGFNAEGNAALTASFLQPRESGFEALEAVASPMAAPSAEEFGQDAEMGPSQLPQAAQDLTKVLNAPSPFEAKTIEMKSWPDGHKEATRSNVFPQFEGKNKGKDPKGKPKGKDYNKGKSKDGKGKPHQYPKGKDQGKGWNNQQQNKGKDKGKGNVKNDSEVCLYCGTRGRWKRDCFKYKSDMAKGIKQVASGDDATTVNDSASVAASASTAAPSHSASNAKAPRRIQMISRFDHSSLDLTDLTEIDDYADADSAEECVLGFGGVLRAVQAAGCLHASAEYFDLAVDDESSSSCEAWSIALEYSAFDLDSECLCAICARKDDASDDSQAGSADEVLPISAHESSSARVIPMSVHVSSSAHVIPMSVRESSSAHVIPMSVRESSSAHEIPVSVHEFVSACDFQYNVSA
ncbi:unnamed protein product [Symbiodinium microadriaticum]|nr:unnamed protein product [Symbiodinium microadriaticum]